MNHLIIFITNFVIINSNTQVIKKQVTAIKNYKTDGKDLKMKTIQKF